MSELILYCQYCERKVEINQIQIPRKFLHYDNEDVEYSVQQGVIKNNWLFPSVCDNCAPNYIIEQSKTWSGEPFTGWFGAEVSRWIEDNPGVLKVEEKLVPRTVYDKVLKITKIQNA